VSANPEKRRAERDRILVAALAHVPFDGWSRQSLARGAEDAGFGRDMALRAFPGGPRDMAAHFADYLDREMVDELERRQLHTMRVRDRIATGVRVRIELMVPHREAVRHLVSYLALPPNAPLAARAAWRAASLMWYAAGDTSADFNHYTKRGLLVPVYTTTVLYWLSDTSAGFTDTWGYLDRRISDVLKIPAAQARVQAALGKLPTPWGLLRAVRGRLNPNI